MEQIQLRDGSTTNDKRLTRIKLFDEKSKEYPVRALVDDKSLRSYTWSCGQFLDQGSDGACVGFSFAHELIARPVVVENIDNKFAKENIYWEAQKIDPWPGGSYPGADPTYEGTAVLAGVKVCKNLGYILEYRWAFSIEDLALAVGHVGPAVLGIPWYDGMFNVRSCGHIHVDGQLAGGHAILCNGVSIKNRTFTLHNSWGPSWGNNGTCKISWDELESLLNEDGEACIPVTRAQP